MSEKIICRDKGMYHFSYPEEWGTPLFSYWGLKFPNGLVFEINTWKGGLRTNMRHVKVKLIDEKEERKWDWGWSKNCVSPWEGYYVGEVFGHSCSRPYNLGNWLRDNQ